MKSADQLDPAKYIPLLRLYQEAARQTFPGVLSNNCCVNATRIAMDTLAIFKLRVKPVAVACAVFNSAAWEWETSGREGERPLDAWCVATDEVDDTEGDWPGHLIATFGDIIIDGSTGQFNNQDKGIDVEVVSLLPFEDEKWPVTIGNQNGTVIHYEPIETTVRPFKDLAGFQRTKENRQIVKTVLKAMKKLEKGAVK
jgi:hypothetical protein